MKSSPNPIKQTMTRLLATALVVTGCSTVDKNLPILQNNDIKVTLSQDLSFVSSFLDVGRNREYIHQGDPAPLFRIGIGANPDSLVSGFAVAYYNEMAPRKYLTPRDAYRHSWKRKENSLELYYWYKDLGGMKVTCRLEAPETDSLVYWSLMIDRCRDTVISIHYPVLNCTDQIRVTSKEGGIVYPAFEGSILKYVYQEGLHHTRRYPGYLSAQLLYFFDRDGGIYYAAHDGNGHPKNLTVKRTPAGGISMNQEYLIPVTMNTAIDMPYRVATGCFGGRWEQGAAVYRNWSSKQKWTRSAISDRDMPGFLKEPVFFINISFTDQRFSTPEKTDRVVEAYHQYYGMPVIVTGFGWEKDGTWLGPDYFPPHRGWDYYSELLEILRKRGDHLHVYTSGFRVAVEAEEGTEFDGYDYFKRNWKASTATRPSGEFDYERRSWAKNYMLCIGDPRNTSMLSGIHEDLFSRGFSGVDLDQNLGGMLSDCYSSAHGHPVGPGPWQTEAMEGFLNEVRRTAKSISDKAFTGIEEPNEYYIQDLDLVHGRSFNSVTWPADTGGIIIPLFLYLYHPYQIEYAGWIDKTFSPMGDERLGIGRAFIFGMPPGVRASGKMTLPAAEISEELRMLKGYTELFSRYPDYLVRGRMISEISLEGAPYFEPIASDGVDTLMTGWKDVQGICWSKSVTEEMTGTGEMTGKGDRIYAIANLTPFNREVSMEPDPRDGSRFTIRAYALDTPLDGVVERDGNGTISLPLEPWQLTVIEPLR